MAKRVRRHERTTRTGPSSSSDSDDVVSEHEDGSDEDTTRRPIGSYGLTLCVRACACVGSVLRTRGGAQCDKLVDHAAVSIVLTNSIIKYLV